MPELPEVETVRRGLLQLLQPPLRLSSLALSGKALRQPIPQDLAGLLSGHQVLNILRRGKYLLWHFESGYLLNHLGMSGSWRALTADEHPGVHDHGLLIWENGLRLAYRDPRRFGLLTWWPQTTYAEHPSLLSLGPEPLADSWTAAVLHKAAQGRRIPIKSLIMEQKVVVGVGNIYACEALFAAGIRPQVPASNLGAKRIARLHTAIRQILQRAIDCGGSTIRDFRQAGGSEGHFQQRLMVYGRQGQACHVCGTKIRLNILSGRSSFWCPRCQRP